MPFLGDVAGADPGDRLAVELISPEVGRSAPEIRFIIVVLPEPFGPIRPSTSFSASLNDIFSTATRPPKRLVTAAAAQRLGGRGAEALWLCPR